MEHKNVGSSSASMVEKDLLGRLEEKNYQDSGVDVSLKIAPPLPPVKKCFLCGQTRTPLWRTGPTGKKTVCNACGIRFRKIDQKLNTSLTLGRPHNAQAGGRAKRG